MVARPDRKMRDVLAERNRFGVLVGGDVSNRVCRRVIRVAGQPLFWWRASDCRALLWRPLACRKLSQRPATCHHKTGRPTVGPRSAG